MKSDEMETAIALVSILTALLLRTPFGGKLGINYL